jgi:hypothetical protein
MQVTMHFSQREIASYMDDKLQEGHKVRFNELVAKT